MADDLATELLSFALSLPEAWEDHPWDETVAKVGKKVFVFMGGGASPDGTAHLTVKLPDSHEEALALPFTESPGYGLDRGHWVTVHAPPDLPLEMLTRWIEESYRTVAPKKVLATLDASTPRGQ